MVIEENAGSSEDDYQRTEGKKMRGHSRCTASSPPGEYALSQSQGKRKANPQLLALHPPPSAAPNTSRVEKAERRVSSCHQL